MSSYFCHQSPLLQSCLHFSVCVYCNGTIACILLRIHTTHILTDYDIFWCVWSLDYFCNLFAYSLIFVLLFQHPLIAEFPSRHFYDCRLKTAPDHECRGIRLLSIWPRNVPLMFCHVEGAEKSLTVTTAEGNEQSKSNDAERDEAVSMHSELL